MKVYIVVEQFYDCRNRNKNRVYVSIRHVFSNKKLAEKTIKEMEDYYYSPVVLEEEIEDLLTFKILFSELLNLVKKLMNR